MNTRLRPHVCKPTCLSTTYTTHLMNWQHSVIVVNGPQAEKEVLSVIGDW